MHDRTRERGYVRTVAPTAGVHGPGRHYSRFQRNRACQVGFVRAILVLLYPDDGPDPFMSPRRNAYDFMTHCSIVNRDGPHAVCRTERPRGKKRTGAAAHTACIPCPAVRRHADSIRFGIFACGHHTCYVYVQKARARRYHRKPGLRTTGPVCDA